MNQGGLCFYSPNFSETSLGAFENYVNETVTRSISFLDNCKYVVFENNHVTM